MVGLFFGASGLLRLWGFPWRPRRRPMPEMSAAVIDFIDAYLARYPSRVLEFGAGRSTLHFGRNAVEWFALEPDSKRVETLRSEIGEQGLSSVSVELLEEDLEAVRRRVGALAAQGRNFDCILVDGFNRRDHRSDARLDVILACKALDRGKTLFLLHDSDRRAVWRRPVIAEWKHVARLADRLREDPENPGWYRKGGLCLFTNDEEIFGRVRTLLAAVPSCRHARFGCPSPDEKP